MPYRNGFIRIRTNRYVYPSHWTASRVCATVPRAISALRESINPAWNLKKCVIKVWGWEKRLHTEIRWESRGGKTKTNILSNPSLLIWRKLTVPAMLRRPDNALICPRSYRCSLHHSSLIQGDLLARKPGGHQEQKGRRIFPLSYRTLVCLWW